MWVYGTVRGAEGKAREVGLLGREPGCRHRDERWMGDVWNAGRLPRGVLGRKHYGRDSQPSFKSHSCAELQSGVWSWGQPPLSLLAMPSLRVQPIAGGWVH